LIGRRIHPLRHGEASSLSLPSDPRGNGLILSSQGIRIFPGAKVKRSEINRIILDADSFIRRHGFYLPPFAYWAPADWAQKGSEAREIVENNLGWDITDFGSGDFQQIGLFLFTLRNGNLKGRGTAPAKTYAEKILVVDVGQVTPMHFHWSKMEDIINRGGGDLAIQVYNSNPEEGLDQSSPVTLSLDGVSRTFQAGETMLLKPGESVTLQQGCYHQFWGEKSRVLVGEVSQVNDDHTDNRFLSPAGRFPTLEEDEPPVYLLSNDYPQFYRPNEI
jgi:D-lyxose ketol-isomerase